MVAVLGLTWLLTKLGESLVGSNDSLAMHLMETRLIGIGAMTAALGALGIIIGVELAVPTDATGYSKELLTTVSAALVAFVAGLSVTAEKADAAVGDYIKDVFQRVYAREDKAKKGQVRLRRGSDAHFAVMSSAAFGLSGWTHDDRWARLEYLSGVKGNGGKLERVEG